jgi:hypothetical protein
MKTPDQVTECLETIFMGYILKFFEADPGWKKFGYGINILDPQHCARKCENKSYPGSDSDPDQHWFGSTESVRINYADPNLDARRQTNLAYSHRF